jgi:hypothetical protein
MPVNRSSVVMVVLVVALVVGSCGNGDEISLGSITTKTVADSASTTKPAAADTSESAEPATATITMGPPGSATPPLATTATASTVEASPSRPPTASAPQPLLLTAQGLGGVPIGDTLDEFAQGLARSVTPMTSSDKSIFAEHQCVVRRLDGLDGVWFMVTGTNPVGPVRRISIGAGSSISTDRGIELGDGLDDVREAYGAGLNEPFDHHPIGGDAVLVSAGSEAYLVFIGDEEARVIEFRLGYKPEALYPEGCV